VGTNNELGITANIFINASILSFIVAAFAVQEVSATPIGGDPPVVDSSVVLLYTEPWGNGTLEFCTRTNDTSGDPPIEGGASWLHVVPTPSHVIRPTPPRLTIAELLSMALPAGTSLTKALVISVTAKVVGGATSVGISQFLDCEESSCMTRPRKLLILAEGPMERFLE
jgi:hypothetical protein